MGLPSPVPYGAPNTIPSPGPGNVSNKRAAPPSPLVGESPAKKQSKWTPEEDALNIELRRTGMKWDDISKRLPGRSAISCRLRYQNYSERRPDWDEEKKNKLARLYARFKEQMWDMIAAEMGMPWRAIEAMHWQMGEHEIAHRANAPVFQLSSSSGSTPTIARSPTTPSAMPVQPVPISARSGLLTESHIHGHTRAISQTAGFVSDSIIQGHNPPRHGRSHSRSHSQNNNQLPNEQGAAQPRSRRNSSTSSRRRANSNSVPPPPLRQHQLTPVSESESTNRPASAVQINQQSIRGTNPGFAVGLKPHSRTGTPESLATSGVAGDRDDED